MVKFKKIFIIILLIIVTGCSIKTEYNMEIRNDKSMDFSMIMAFDDELIEGMNSMNSENMQFNGIKEQKKLTEQQKWEIIDSMIEDSSDKAYEELGFKKEKYIEGKYKGYRFVETISNIDDISGTKADFDLNEFQKLSESIVFVKSGNKYKANFVLKNENEESTQGMDIMFDIKFVVTLPNKPLNHNATKVSEDGKTLTWDLIDLESNNIEFEFKINNNLMYLWFLLAIIVVIILICIFMIKSKQNKKKVTNNLKNIQPIENNSAPGGLTEEKNIVSSSPSEINTDLFQNINEVSDVQINTESKND